MVNFILLEMGRRAFCRYLIVYSLKILECDALFDLVEILFIYYCWMRNAIYDDKLLLFYFTE